MHKKYWLMGCLAVVLLASGCFQQAGVGPDDLAVVDNANPTWTPLPTETPFVAPTNTPADVLPLPTQESVEPQQFFPTSTDAFGVGGAFVPTADFGVAQLATQDPGLAQPQQGLEEIYITATFIVQRATQTEAFIQTATAGGPLFTPTPFPIATLAPTVDPNLGAGGGVVVPGVDCVHEVVRGENLFRIALRYGVNLQDLAARNGIANVNIIRVGQRITIPGCGTTGQFPPPTSTAPNPGTGNVYVVQQGDTLFRISLRFGTTVHCIAAANNIPNINLILINQQLVIPAGC